MATYSGSFTINIGTTASPAMDFKPGPAATSRILEVFFQVLNTTASTWGLTKSSNVPIQTNAVQLPPEDPGNAQNSQTFQSVTWSTAPTVGSFYSRRVSLGATAGCAIIITNPRGLGLSGSAGNSFVIWNLATNSTNAYTHVVTDE